MCIFTVESDEVSEQVYAIEWDWDKSEIKVEITSVDEDVPSDRQAIIALTEKKLAELEHDVAKMKIALHILMNHQDLKYKSEIITIT